jgi:hypothetical protein
MQFFRRSEKVLTHSASAPHGLDAPPALPEGPHVSVSDVFRRTAPAQTMRPFIEHTMAPVSPTRPALHAALPPAGMSKTLRNCLSFPEYRDTICTYDAKDALYRAPKMSFRAFNAPPGVAPAPLRLDPAYVRPGGQMPQPKRINETYFGTSLGGKKMVPDNPQTGSNVDTIVWGRDIDISDQKGDWLATEMFRGAAGLPTSDFVPLPPVCNRTFGETTPEVDSGFPFGSASHIRHAFSAVR